MINELQQLAEAISSAGIRPDEYHRKYLTLPKPKPNHSRIQLYVGPDGFTDINEIDGRKASELRKYGTNQATFPDMKLTPLYRLTDPTQKKLVKQMQDGKIPVDVSMLRSWKAEQNWSQQNSKIKNCLFTTPHEILALLDNSHNAIKQYFSEIVSCLDRLGNIQGVFDALSEFAYLQLEEGKNIHLCLELLFHLGDGSKDASKDRGEQFLFFDYSDWIKYGYSVASRKFTENLNKELIKSEVDSSTIIAVTEKDAFGKPYVPINEAMPKVKLGGGIGEISLYTNFAEQHCQNRYRNFERGSSFPLSKEKRTELKSALEWAAAVEHRDNLWTESGDHELTFIYPSILENGTGKLVRMTKKCSTNQKSKFIEEARIVAAMYKGVSPNRLPPYIHFFTLRKIDKARTKVIYSSECTLQWLNESAEKWHTGCCNLPDFPFILADVPFPLDIAAIVNRKWKLDGSRADTDKSGAKIMHSYDGIDLLLSYEDAVTRDKWFRRISQETDILARVYGNAKYRSAQKFDDRPLAEALRVIGLLMAKKGINREDYMKNYPYLLGQFLQITDKLHVLYCQGVRNNDIPTVLVGSSFYTMISERPSAALALLSQRVVPYISWAKKTIASGVKDISMVKKVAWLYRQYQELASELAPILEGTTRFDDYEKAQLFLGYLAKLPDYRNENTNNEENNTNND